MLTSEIIIIIKHGFFSVKTILVTKLLKTHGVFHLLLTESFIFIQNLKIFKEIVTTFSVLVKKLSNIYVIVLTVGFQFSMFMHWFREFKKILKSIFFKMEFYCSLWRNDIVHHRRKPMMNWDVQWLILFKYVDFWIRQYPYNSHIFPVMIYTSW